jgi:hypothetical protein
MEISINFYKTHHKLAEKPLKMKEYPPRKPDIALAYLLRGDH